MCLYMRLRSRLQKDFIDGCSGKPGDFKNLSGSRNATADQFRLLVQETVDLTADDAESGVDTPEKISDDVRARLQACVHTHCAFMERVY